MSLQDAVSRVDNPTAVRNAHLPSVRDGGRVIPFNKVLRGDSMLTSSVTTKGQVTIPVELRKKLGIKPGDRVGFVESDGKVEIRRQENRVSAAFGVLKARKGVTLKQIDETIAGKWKQRARR
jgi:antitoxin PrlF